jgi:hypothetical protein
VPDPLPALLRCQRRRPSEERVKLLRVRCLGRGSSEAVGTDAVRQFVAPATEERCCHATTPRARDPDTATPSTARNKRSDRNMPSSYSSQSHKFPSLDLAPSSHDGRTTRTRGSFGARGLKPVEISPTGGLPPATATAATPLPAFFSGGQVQVSEAHQPVGRASSGPKPNCSLSERTTSSVFRRCV